MKMTTLVQLSFHRDNENFQLNFDLKEEFLGEIFDKLEIMLAALGFVLDGKMLNLVDKEDETCESNSGLGFLAEDLRSAFTGPVQDQHVSGQFTVHPGGKE
jgi:hypothetical protein